MAATQNIVTPQQLSDDWLEQRRRFIGGSDAASLFAEETRYGCATRLFFDKMGQAPDYPRTPREERILRRGQIWENVVAFYFQETTGLKIRRMGARISKDVPFMGVNMDRQIIGVTTEELKRLWPDVKDIQEMEGECGPGYLECKTANEWMFKDMVEKGVPNDYILQVNHGLTVTYYRWGVFAVLEPGSGDFATFPYLFKENLAAEQVKRSQEFWAMLEAGKMPQPVVNDKRCKSCIYRRSCPKSAELLAQAGAEFSEADYQVDDNPELVELLADYRVASEVADQKNETVDLIKGRIKEVLGERTKIEVPSAGARINFAKTKPPMRWDSKALDGTVKDFRRYEIPDGLRCQSTQHIGEAPQAVVIVEHEGNLLATCEPCGFLGLKNGYTLVARKGVADVVQNCKRAGEPSRPLKIALA